MFALVDCNNFYASCERVFNPGLNEKPIVVLSNNDGCVIARSNEAKSLGIKMGVPIHLIKDLVETNNVTVFSSNYVLYGDMSQRVMSVLSSYAQESEIYSIDEIFLNFSGILTDLKTYGTEIVKTTIASTGIPVSMGIAPTKTLSKLANRFAKKYSKYQNICIIDNEHKRIKALQITQIEDIWGIGQKYSEKLIKQGIKTAYDFTQATPSWIRKNMTITGEKIWRELQGESCIELETIQSYKKQICTSRSFGNMISDYETIAEAVSTHAMSCAYKLRKQNTLALSLMVFVHTNQFRNDLPQYARNIIITLPVPTSDGMEIVHYSLKALKQIFKEGFQYKKAGVIITEITNNKAIQTNLFDNKDRDKSKSLMNVMDKLNDSYGKNKIRLAVQGTGQKWQLKQENLSPCYTTRLSDIINVKI